jgi:hypothetical protein
MAGSFALPTLPASKLAAKKETTETPTTLKEDPIEDKNPDEGEIREANSNKETSPKSDSFAKPQPPTSKPPTPSAPLPPPKPQSGPSQPPPAPTLAYKEPEWSGLPKSEHSLEVLKGGAIVEKVDVTKPSMLIGESFAGDCSCLAYLN